MPVYDLALDHDNGAPMVVDGDLALLTDRKDQIAQALRLTLRTVVGEWFLDTTHGVDYFNTVLIKGAQQARVESEFRDKILGVKGVKALTKFQAEYDQARRRFRLVFVVSTDEGNIPIEVVVPPTAPPPPEEA